jgi:hypothetical protein
MLDIFMVDLSEILHYSDLMQWGVYLLSVPARSILNKIPIEYERKQLSRYSVSTTEVQILTRDSFFTTTSGLAVRSQSFVSSIYWGIFAWLIK